MSGSAEVIRNLYAWANMKIAGIGGAGGAGATGMQNYARTHRRWVDRTGNARAGLNGGSFWQNPFMLIIFIAHSMEYGIWLEFIQDRKYAILEEARDSQSKNLLESAKRIMNA